MTSAREAWLALLAAYVRAVEVHRSSAELQSRMGREDRARAARRRVVVVIARFDAALAEHPEWASDAPRLPVRVD